MMAKKPDDRYQTAREVLRDLNRLREGFSSTAAQAALAQSASSATTQVQPAPPASDPLASGTQMIPAPARHWGRWFLITSLLLAAGSIGAAVHWQTNPRKLTDITDANGFPLERTPNPARSLEEDLRKRLSLHSKSDHEALNALLELAMLLMRERRYDEALELFNEEKLKNPAANMPALSEARMTIGQLTAKSVSQPIAFEKLVAHLGRGIILSQRDLADESNDEFKKIMRVPAAPKAKFSQRQAVDLFLGRYDHWKRTVADALDRNSKNLGKPLLAPELDRYRRYSRMP
jgi:tetratricopeptide (TPR) repeat protein